MGVAEENAYQSPRVQPDLIESGRSDLLPLPRSRWRVRFVVLLCLHGGTWLTDAALGYGIIGEWLSQGASVRIGLFAVLSTLRLVMGVLFFIWARDVWDGCHLRAVGFGITVAVIHTAIVAAIMAS